jgi:ankyrin repeat protein
MSTADADGTTALQWASYRDDLESAEILIARAPADAANDLGATALWAASQNGGEAVVRRC